MSGVFNSRPPMPRYNHTWDVDIVLKYLISLGPCENLGLKLLTLKVASLMALSTACRSSELYHLDLKFMQISPNEIVFKIVQLTKTRKVGMEPVKLIFKEYENERLDVRKHNMQYQKITEPIRNGENIFFLSFLKPHKPVRSCTIARWLKQYWEMQELIQAFLKHILQEGPVLLKQISLDCRSSKLWS